MSKSDKKFLHIGIPRDCWTFLKDLSRDKEVPMSAILIDIITKLKNKHEKV